MDNSRIAHCICQSVEISISGEPSIMAYCHCDSCRSWLGAPIHAASLWPTKNVNVTKGEEHLSEYHRTEHSLRHFCKLCGSPVLVRHPGLGLTDVPAHTIKHLDFKPAIHVNYAERVMPIKDGLPKFAGMPDKDGKGELIPE